MGGRVEIRGLENIIKNMQDLTPKTMAELKKSMDFAGNVLEHAVKEKAKLTDHSLAQLAEMGHPYAARFGTDSGPHPDEFVHKQSGLLYDNIETIVRQEGNKAMVAVGVNKSKVSYISYLINGTSKMRPRDFFGRAWQETRKTVLAIIKAGLRPRQGSRHGNTGRTE